jgi:3-hydroxyacyl-CoA dehydrogenase/enoyl-CoA hydratase/3-hydroxybutyryl-CoA epimerase
MIFMMINEAARCLEEKVAAEAADIDLAMILGAGFPGTRGGPLRYADALGVNRLVAQMSKLAESSQRFAPCDWLRDLAARDGKIYSD